MDMYTVQGGINSCNKLSHLELGFAGWSYMYM